MVWPAKRIAAVALPDLSIPPKLREKISILAQKRATGIKLRALYEYGADPSPKMRLSSAQFLHKELPIRVAQRVEELYSLPHGLSSKRPIIELRNMYASYVGALLDIKRPETVEEEHDFTEILGMVLQRHATVVQLMSTAVLQLKVQLGKDYDDNVSLDIDNALNRFYLARIGLRFLVSHHLEARNRKPGFQGIIQSQCSPAEVARRAADDAREVCGRVLGQCPDVTLHGQVDTTFTYVPGHLHYMLFELLKNSMRATVDTHSARDHLPPVRIVIAQGDEDVTIKISDEGGGIKRSLIKDIWRYHHTSAAAPEDMLKALEQFDPQRGYDGPIMAGYGVGLPLSRLYARYFGGSLELMSMEAFGTDAYLHLCRLGTACENLPAVVLSSPANRDSTPPGDPNGHPVPVPPF